MVPIRGSVRSRLSQAVAGVALVASILIGPAPAARAAVFTPTRFDDPPPGTCDPGDCSLREAVNAANASPGPDEVVLGAGTYILTIPADGTPDDGLDGDLDVTDSLTLRGQGASATTINANGTVTSDRGIHVDPNSGGASPTATILDLTVRGGTGSFGMGIFLDMESSGVISDVTLTGADGNAFGGGLFINNNTGNSTITRTTFSGNRVDSFGAALFSQSVSAVTVTDSLVTGNINDSGFGSGVWNQGSGTFTVSDTTISDNTGPSFGAAFWSQGTGVTVLENSTVSGNRGDSGAGIWLQGSDSVEIRNTTVSGNRTDQDGAGLYSQQPAPGTLTVLNSTITENRADDDGNGSGNGGGIYIDGGSSVTVKNSIVAGNFDPTSDPDCFGPVTSGGFNLIGILSAGCTFTPAAGDQTGTPAAQVAAGLSSLGDHGGPTQTHELSKSSPAVDAAGSGAPPADQRGAPRAGPPDIGAYERVLCSKILVTRVGTDGNDSLKGTAGKDGILALGGKDTLRGRGAGDGLCGGPGKDLLKGGPGKDRLNGGPGRDVCNGQGAKDKAKACEQEKSIP